MNTTNLNTLTAVFNQAGLIPSTPTPATTQPVAENGAFLQLLQTFADQLGTTAPVSMPTTTDPNTWLATLLNLFNANTAQPIMMTLDPTGEASATNLNGTPSSLTQIMAALQPVLSQNSVPTPLIDSMMAELTLSDDTPTDNDALMPDLTAMLATAAGLAQSMIQPPSTPIPTPSAPVAIQAATAELPVKTATTNPTVIATIATPAGQTATTLPAGQIVAGVIPATTITESAPVKPPTIPVVNQPDKTNPAMVLPNNQPNTSTPQSAATFTPTLNQVNTTTTVTAPSPSPATTDTVTVQTVTTTPTTAAPPTQHTAAMPQVKETKIETVEIQTTQQQPTAVVTNPAATPNTTPVQRPVTVVEAKSQLPDVPALHQIVNSAKLISEQGQTGVRLHLQPESLGNLIIQLHVVDGEVSIRMITETAQARTLIQDNLPQLKNAFDAQGLVAGSLDVNVSGGDTSAFNASQQQKSWMYRHTNGNHPTIATVEPTTIQPGQRNAGLYRVNYQI